MRLPKMAVWKSPWCGCCGNWVEHMKAAGFEVDFEAQSAGSFKTVH
jgi:hypothetical protein